MIKKNVLIIGSGAREHALGWKLKQSKRVGEIYFAPGNSGTEMIGKNVAIDVLDIAGLVKFAKEKDINFTIAGPDDCLAAGVVDAFYEENLDIFGPSKKAARIESSKSFAKELMIGQKIPTADFDKFTDAQKAKYHLAGHKFPVVIKASGLALGKGVVIANNLGEAEKAVDEMIVKKIFGKSGEEIIIEEFLEGKEVSVHAFCDGENVVMFPTARDHKPIFEGNLGPNTGGMGTIAPVEGLGEEFLENVKRTIMLPAIVGMKARGSEFTGCLFAGLMLTKDGPKVLEFNSRFGDPEMESYMRILDSDLLSILEACTNRGLCDINVNWKKEKVCTIILASKGYPGKYEKGVVVNGLEKKYEGVEVFHAGTKKDGNHIVTNGGRVLAVTATGKTLDQALGLAYKAIGSEKIYFEGMQYREDIGKI